MADWTEAEILQAAQNPSASWAQRSAAERMLACIGTRAETNAKQAGADFDRICDRTTGKPTQEMRVLPESDQKTLRVIELTKQSLQSLRKAIAV